jgi:hypothetical protein
VLKVTSLLDVESDGAYMVGIHGIGGIEVYCSMWKVYTLTIHANIPTIKI